jgi:hypothetical protein
LLLSLGCTSIRLEMSFWDTLEEIAAKEEMSLRNSSRRCTMKSSTTCLIYRSKSAAIVPDFRGNAAAILDAAE